MVELKGIVFVTVKFGADWQQAREWDNHKKKNKKKKRPNPSESSKRRNLRLHSSRDPHRFLISPQSPSSFLTFSSSDRNARPSFVPIPRRHQIKVPLTN